VHRTGVYSVVVGPKGLALERFSDIKKKKQFNNFDTSMSTYLMTYFTHVTFFLLLQI
jgi:hypothetical protein